MTTFYNPISGETLKHTKRPDGTRNLFVWQGDTTSRDVDHQHNVISKNGVPAYIRDFNRRVIADDRL
jgi:hypothetical protein